MPSNLKRTKHPSISARRGIRLSAVVLVLALASVAALVIFGLPRGALGSAAVSTSPLPPAKATILARSQQGMAGTQAAAQRTKPTYAAPSVIAPTATMTTGLFQTHQGPFSNSTFSIENGYRGQVNGHWVVIYAGTAWTAFPRDGLGALRVYAVDSGLVGVFDAPDGSGALTITGVNGSSLEIISDKGARLTFDMVTNSFGR